MVLELKWHRRFLTLFLLALLSFAGWWGCVRPSSQVVVPVPGLSAIVEMQLLPDFDEGAYQVHIRNDKGQLTSKLWSNWGPATRATFYLAPGDKLVVIGGGDSVYVFAINDDFPPEKVTNFKDVLSADGKEWHFIGTTHGRNPIRFTPPTRLTECIDLLGAGETPYRKAFQVNRAC